LQSEVDEETYVRQPTGLEEYGPGGEPLVYRLKKPLSGLRQAPRNWSKALSQHLVDGYGLKPSGADPRLDVGDVTKEGYIVVLVYVGDTTEAGSGRAEVCRFKAATSKRFKVKDLGTLKWMLGIETVRDREKRTLKSPPTSVVHWRSLGSRVASLWLHRWRECSTACLRTKAEWNVGTRAW